MHQRAHTHLTGYPVSTCVHYSNVKTAPKSIVNARGDVAASGDKATGSARVCTSIIHILTLLSRRGVRNRDHHIRSNAADTHTHTRAHTGGMMLIYANAIIYKIIIAHVA